MSRPNCERTLSPMQTLMTSIFQVLPMHANPLGMLFGGVMEDWMVQVSNMEATRVARRPTLLASLENIYFLSPVLVGENAMITAWVDYVGTSSIDVSLLVEAENPIMNERRLTTLAHMTYVAVGRDLRPAPVGFCIEPRTPEEEALYEDALRIRKAREERIKDRKQKVFDTLPPKGLLDAYTVVTNKVVMPEDVMQSNALFAGRLMRLLDEITALVATRYAKGPVVTASVDSTDFYTPILLGETIVAYSTLTYVGKSSMEVVAKVIKRDEITGEEKHTTTSYFTLVHVGPTGRSEPIELFKPTEDWQKKMLEEAEARRDARLRALQAFRENAEKVRELLSKRNAMP
ncbi:MAG: hotdog domain-containing protein [Acidilobus sp.]